MVVEILMCLAETGRPRRVRESLHRRTVSPIHSNGERVQRPRISEGTGKHTGSVLVDICGNQALDLWCDIGDRCARGRDVAAQVVVCKADGDQVVVGRGDAGIVVQILMSDIERTAADRNRLRRTLAPIDC